MRDCIAKHNKLAQKGQLKLTYLVEFIGMKCRFLMGSKDALCI